jgi:hypothetical protein
MYATLTLVIIRGLFVIHHRQTTTATTTAATTITAASTAATSYNKKEGYIEVFYWTQ